jgi:DNA-binding CsgD family transcriptional regulator
VAALEGVVLVGREVECARVAGVLDGARRGRGAALLVSGEAGVGKTALLGWAMREGGDLQLLHARGLESESDLPYAGLSWLLRPVLALVEELPSPQAAALSAALSLAEGEVADRFLVYAATLNLLAAASESSPLLVCVDDFHWLDAASREALVFSARRLGSENIALLLASRSDEDDGVEPAELPRLTVTGLEPDSAAELIRADGRAAADVADELSRSTGGNPLAIVELLETLGPAQLDGGEPLPDPLPTGPRVAAAFSRRLEALGPETEMALVVAAASDSGDLAEVHAALTGLGLDPGALDPAEAARVIELAPPEVTFRHPLLRSAVYQRAPEADRRRAHAALADVPEGMGGGRRAWHLAMAASRPDESVALKLDAAAQDAQARGAPLAAASALEAAARLSPNRGDRARRLLDAGRYTHLGGRPERALPLLDRAAADATDEHLRVQIEHARCLAEFLDPAAFTRFQTRLSELAERVAADDPAAAALMLGEVALTHAMTGRPRSAIEVTERAGPVAARAGGPPEAVVLAVRALGMALAGQTEGARELLLEAEPGIGVIPPAQAMQLAIVPGVVRTYLGEYDDARSVLLRRIESARLSAALHALPLALGVLATVDFRRGDWLSAYSEATEAVQAGHEVGQAAMLGAAYSVLACVEAGQGRESSCRGHATRARESAADSGADSLRILADTAIGFLELGLGRGEAAAEVLEPVVRLERSNGIALEASQSLPLLIEAYVQAGRIDAAERELPALEACAVHSPTRWTASVTARCHALLATDAEFEARFEDALAAHDELTAGFERARTELHYGERLSRARRSGDARPHLATALATFDALGAAPWAARARAELEAGGRASTVRDPSLAALTPQEVQVALKVSEGATNREAASALFVTVKTIEAHLRSIYRKLGIRSRSELTRLVVMHEQAIGGRAGADSAEPPPD